MEDLNTPMDASATSWLSDLDMDDYNLFPEECPLNFLDVDEEEFLSHDIATALPDQTLHQSLSSECTSKTLSNNSSTDETSFDFERPSKMLKTISTSSNSSTITNLSPSSSFSSFQSQILSFDNPKPSLSETNHFYGFDCTLNPPQNEMVSVSTPQLGNQRFPTQNPKGSPKNQNLETKTSHSKRSPAHAQDHIMAERKRREKLSQSFIALAALVPGLKKMDKASVLGDAIKYVKELKERLAVLEEQSKKTRAESVVVVNKPELSGDDDSSSCDESIDADGGSELLFQVEVRVSGQEMLLRIHCQKQKGLLVKILAQIQTYHLLVVNSSVLPFGDSILDITIVAQMGDDYRLTTKELVKNLRVAALKIMS
ncbi:transcription factor bHLH18-like [Abrus precatorius]|uniref:Transcription factor bHLH18-like n=1 Tax=Abrus precatorius TaxID=3816 RepID=A0A8B8KYQ5_ABRPR|nr:transcription factor bHLH18-like [Abrus precatorius]